ncbi:MAG: hypothetical protein C0425_00350 [Chlorobiaceae bacterium]|nr:hypothetical protein [Chlorobiaceae bacterium]MBA4308774.1 hypothetical protein [Chlorobiaceae bacterium]
MRKLFTLVLLVLISLTLNAQLNYNFSTSTGNAYVPVSGGTQFNWVVVGNINDNYSTSTPIGFSFTYNGAPFDSFQVSTNGFIVLGNSTLTSSVATNALWGLQRNVIAPLWDDLSAAAPDSLRSITYALTGAAGSRVLTVEWRNVRWSATATTNSNFQVRLHQATGRIELVYGGIVSGSLPTSPASIGLNANTTIITALQATGFMMSVNLGGIAGARNYQVSMGYEFGAVAAAPDSGTILAFSPVTPSRIAAGAYTIGGTNPTWTNFSQAALALNVNGVNGPVTINVRAGSYDDILHLINVAGTSSTNTITIQPEAGASVTLSPLNGSSSTTGPGSTAGDPIIKLEGSQFVTINGFNITDNPLNSTAITKFEMGVLVTNSVVSNIQGSILAGSRFNTLNNLTIDMNAQTGILNAGATGIRFGTNGATNDSTHTNSWNRLLNLNIQDFFANAIRFFGFSTNIPERGNIISATGTNRSFIGNVSLNSNARDVRVIEVDAASDLTIERTDIQNITNIGTTTQQVYAIWTGVSSTALNSGTFNFRSLNISGILNSGAGVTTASAFGIFVNNFLSGSTINIHDNIINNIMTNTSSTGTVRGISVSPAANTIGTINIFNNFISNIQAPRSTAAPGVRGIDLQQASRFNVYYNTVYLDTLVTAATHHSAVLVLTNFGVSTADVRNNIFVNLMGVGSGVSRASVIYASSTANLLRLAPTSNNNLYFAGTPTAKNLISFDVTNADSTLNQYRLRIGGGRDVNSFSALPPFINTATKPYDLRNSTTIANPANNGGLPISGYATDYFGTARSTTTPDLGAQEFAGITPADTEAPLFSFTQLVNDHSLAGRTVDVTITDRSGVALGINAPRIYFKKRNEVSYAAATPIVNGNIFTFNITYSSLSSGFAAVGDTIQYYLAAQDLLGNGGTFPFGGAGLNPPGTTAPTVPLQYIIQNSALSGTYTVGLTLFKTVLGKNLEARVITLPENATFDESITTSNSEYSGDINSIVKNDPSIFSPIESIVDNSFTPKSITKIFENGREYEGPDYIYLNDQQREQFGLPSNIMGVYLTLTAAVTEFNNRGVSGPVTFLLVDSLYNEAGHVSGQMQISGNLAFPTSTVNTLTIRPATNLNPRIQFNTVNACLVVQTANVIIQGSNTGTGTSRNLTITNLLTGGLLFVATADNVVIRNTIIEGNSRTTSSFGVVYDNSVNGLFDNNIVRKSNFGFQSQNNVRNITVSNNFFGSGVDTLKLQNAGVNIFSTNGFRVENNTITGLLRSATSSTAGIVVGVVAGGVDAQNGTITRNRITDIKQTGTGANGFGAFGIRLTAFMANSNITISNNVIADIQSVGDNGFVWNPHGIYITEGGGYRIYNNSINLFGNIDGTTGTAGQLITHPVVGGITLTSGTSINNIELLNNSITNNLTMTSAAGRSYAIFLFRPNSAIRLSDYNNLFVTGTQGVIGYASSANRLTFADWQANTGRDANSVSANPGYTSNTNLAPNIASVDAWTLNGNGLPLADVTVDFLGNTRSSTIANGATDIGAFEFTPTAAAPNATPSGAPVASGTQTFTHLGRTLGSITWGSGGVVPTAVTFQLVSGTNPPSAPSGFQFGNHYWIVNATGGSGFTYSITFNYQTNSLGAAVENQLRVGKRDAGVWSGNIISSVNTVNKTITATGLLNFSDFAIYSGAPSDPDTLIALNAGLRHINLLWRDNSNNETGFEIQRKLGDIVSPNAYVVVATVPPNTQTYADTSIALFTQYTYRVRAINPFVNSGYSNQTVILSLIPVELTSFAATTDKQTVNLTWVTATEKNNQGFEIERLMNGEWEKIAFVEGKGTVLSPTSYSYTDNFKGITHKGRIEYRLRQIDFGGAYEYSNIINVDVDFTPKEFALAQNYPNPFNPTTRIEYQIPNDASVKIELYSISGEKVADLVNTELKTGFYVVDISASSLRLSSGVYIYRMIATEKASGKQFVNVKRMMLIK